MWTLLNSISLWLLPGPDSGADVEARASEQQITVLSYIQQLNKVWLLAAKRRANAVQIGYWEQKVRTWPNYGYHQPVAC